MSNGLIVLIARDTIADVAGTRLGLCADISARALWIYDYLQTFSAEVQAIWLRKLSVMSIVFLLNRYMMLLSIVASLYEDAPGSGSMQGCNYVFHLKYLTGVFTVACTSVVFVMRIHALYGDKRWISVVASVPILGRIGIDFWTFGRLYGSNDKTDSIEYSWSPRCTEKIVGDANVFYSLNAGTASLALAFDALILVLTIRKTWYHVMEMRSLGQTGLMEILLRDGSIYFLLVFIINVVQVSTNIVSSKQDDSSLSYLAQFAAIINAYYALTPNMLASRLVLNLRIYKVPSDPVLMSDPDSSFRAISEIRFPPESDTHQKGPGQHRISGNTGVPPDHALP